MASLPPLQPAVSHLVRYAVRAAPPDATQLIREPPLAEVLGYERRTAGRDNLSVQTVPKVSVLIPTRARPRYLDVTLRSIAPQAQRHGAEVLVISDGPDDESREVAHHHGARMLELPRPSGLNAVRNVGVNAASGDLLLFVDDDVIAPPEWLEAYLRAASASPDREV